MEKQKRVFDGIFKAKTKSNGKALSIESVCINSLELRPISQKSRKTNQNVVQKNVSQKKSERPTDRLFKKNREQPIA